MGLNFSIERLRGLNYKFTNTSQEIPEGSTPLWDFGDNTGTSNEATPQHLYAEPGDYVVKLSLVDLPEQGEKSISLAIHTKTSSLTSLLDIALSYIPSVLNASFDLKKEALKDKWLLYIQPLVNHEVPEAYYYVENYYEALEIELTGQLVAYDFLISEITKNMVGAITSSTTPDEEGTGEVKKVITGPTEAEFFSDMESSAKLLKALTDLNKPGGVMDGLKINLCQLASRLDIYLPMCGIPNQVRMPFEVVRRT